MQSCDSAISREITVLACACVATIHLITIEDNKANHINTFHNDPAADPGHYLIHIEVGKERPLVAVNPDPCRRHGVTDVECLMEYVWGGGQAGGRGRRAGAGRRRGGVQVAGATCTPAVRGGGGRRFGVVES